MTTWDGRHRAPSTDLALTLAGEVCTGEVGAIFCIEDSRLARNGREWHYLLDLCSMTGTLIIDPRGIYDPRLSNDRLMMGLDGTRWDSMGLDGTRWGSMAEFELSLFRQRSQAALLAKAKRGELRISTAGRCLLDRRDFAAHPRSVLGTKLRARRQSSIATFVPRASILRAARPSPARRWRSGREGSVKLRIERLGRIKKAEIDIRPLTVLIGRTGPTRRGRRMRSTGWYGSWLGVRIRSSLSCRQRWKVRSTSSQPTSPFARDPRTGAVSSSSVCWSIEQSSVRVRFRSHLTPSSRGSTSQKADSDPQRLPWHLTERRSRSPSPPSSRFEPGGALTRRRFRQGGRVHSEKLRLRRVFTVNRRPTSRSSPRASLRISGASRGRHPGRRNRWSLRVATSTSSR